MLFEPPTHVIERQSLHATGDHRPSAKCTSRGAPNNPQPRVAGQNPTRACGGARCKRDPSFPNQEACGDTREILWDQGPQHQCKKHHSRTARDESTMTGASYKSLRLAHVTSTTVRLTVN